jgi:hypothetical protein
VCPSGGQKVGSLKVLIQECREDKGEQNQGADLCKKFIITILCDNDGILLVE